MTMYKQVASLFQSFRQRDTLELEVNIRQKSENGIPFEMVDLIYDLFVKWTSSKHLVFESQQTLKDFFYQRDVRQRSCIGFPDEIITKTTIASIAAKCPERKMVEFHITLKDEVPLLSFSTSIAAPIYVRIQTMWKFVYKQAFIYILKQVQSGKTTEEACNRDPTYELEIEVVRDSNYLKEHTNEEMANALISKALDLTGPKKHEQLKMELITKDPKRKKETEPKRRYVKKEKKIKKKLSFKKK